LLKNVISANGAVTGDVAQSPTACSRTSRTGDESNLINSGNGVGVDDHLSVMSGSGGNVRQSPRGFKLKITRGRGTEKYVIRGRG